VRNRYRAKKSHSPIDFDSFLGCTDFQSAIEHSSVITSLERVTVSIGYLEAHPGRRNAIRIVIFSPPGLIHMSKNRPSAGSRITPKSQQYSVTYIGGMQGVRLRHDLAVTLRELLLWAKREQETKEATTKGADS
jgi:hypothetical protein